MGNYIPDRFFDRFGVCPLALCAATAFEEPRQCQYCASAYKILGRLCKVSYQLAQIKRSYSRLQSPTGAANKLGFRDDR